MTSLVRHITFDCAGDPHQLALFWSQVVDRPVDPDDKPGDPEVIIWGSDGVPSLLFIRVPESKTVKNRLHLDLLPADRTRDEEVDRLLGLGATLIADHRKPDGPGWVTLADPQGNEFCVERAPAERA